MIRKKLKTNSSNRLSPIFQLYLFLVSSLIFIRLALKCFFKIRVGWWGMTDYDLLVPGTIAFFCFFQFLQKKEPLPWRPQWNLFIRYLGILLVFFSITLWFSSLSFEKIIYLKLTWFAILTGALFWGFQIFIPLNYFFRNPNKWFFIPCGLIAFSSVIYQQTWEVLWPLWGRGTSEIVCGIFPKIFDKGRCEFLPNSTVILLTRYFRADLGPGCLGGDAQFLNLLSCFFFCFSQARPLNFSNLFLRWLFGAAGLFLLNILRILIFSGVAIATIRTSFAAFGRGFFLNSFHANLGWFIYLLFIYFLNSFFIHILRKAESKKVNQANDGSFGKALAIVD